MDDQTNNSKSHESPIDLHESQLEYHRLLLQSVEIERNRMKEFQSLNDSQESRKSQKLSNRHSFIGGKIDQNLSDLISDNNNNRHSINYRTLSSTDFERGSLDQAHNPLIKSHLNRNSGGSNISGGCHGNEEENDDEDRRRQGQRGLISSTDFERGSLNQAHNAHLNSNSGGSNISGGCHGNEEENDDEDRRRQGQRGLISSTDFERGSLHQAHNPLIKSHLNRNSGGSGNNISGGCHGNEEDRRRQGQRGLISSTAARITDRLMSAAAAAANDGTNRFVGGVVNGNHSVNNNNNRYLTGRRRFRTVVKADRFSRGAYLSRETEWRDPILLAAAAAAAAANPPLQLNLSSIIDNKSQRIDFSRIKFQRQSIIDNEDRRERADETGDRSWVCRRCGVTNGDRGFKFCPACSAPNDSDAPTPIVAVGNGGWRCSRCDTPNDDDRSVCVFCFAAAAAEAVTEEPSKKRRLSPIIIDTDKRGWNCGDCWADNSADSDRCVCCTAANPARQTFLSFGGPQTGQVIRFGESSHNDPRPGWSCPECWIDNGPGTDACVCCSQPCPGGRKSPALLSFTFAPPKSVECASFPGNDSCPIDLVFEFSEPGTVCAP